MSDKIHKPEHADAGTHKLFLALCACALVGAFLLEPILGALIHSRQTRMPESRLVLATQALEQGATEEAVSRIGGILNNKSIQRYEGRGESALSIEYAQVGKQLHAKGIDDLARGMAVRSIRSYHGENRGLEFNEPWVLWAEIEAYNDEAKLIQLINIVGSHSSTILDPFFNRLDAQGHPMAGPYRRYAELRRRLRHLSPDALLRVPGVNWTGLPPSDVRIAMDHLYIDAHLANGNTNAARSVASELEDLFPRRVDVQWLREQTQGNQPIHEFINELMDERGVEVIGFRNLMATQTATMPEKSFQESQAFRFSGTASYYGSGASMLKFISKVNAEHVYLVAAGSAVMGVHPIVLVTIDDRPTFPVLLDGSQPAIKLVGHNLPPGKHQILFEYLNDFSVELGQKKYDRNLHLLRVVLGDPAEPELPPELEFSIE